MQILEVDDSPRKLSDINAEMHAIVKDAAEHCFDLSFLRTLLRNESAEIRNALPDETRNLLDNALVSLTITDGENGLSQQWLMGDIE